MIVAGVVISHLTARQLDRLGYGNEVKCLVCGHTHTVDVGHCLRTGWPEHCGKMMELQKRHQVVLGERLRAHREAAGLTLEQLAASMEVSPSTVSRWETGKAELRVAQLRQLGQVLGIDDYWKLLQEEGP